MPAQRPALSESALFQPKLVDMKYGRLFAQLLKDKSSQPLRDVVQDDIPGLLASSLQLDKADDEKYVAIISAINIVKSFANFG